VEDTSQILSDSPLPAFIKRIIIFVEVNNRDRYDSQLVSHLTRLRDVVTIQSHQVKVITLPQLVDEPSSVLF